MRPHETPAGRLIYDISIHASREGCDKGQQSYLLSGNDFNPRIPRGMRLTAGWMPGGDRTFQSTHPARDATSLFLISSTIKDISIHASREGCDVRLINHYPGPRNFNPRIPRGMRQNDGLKKDKGVIFQSTHPARDATGMTQEEAGKYIDFNPRIPRGMRHRIGAGAQFVPTISIHASREGCDVARRPKRAQLTYFNPRIPRGMRLISLPLFVDLHVNFNPRIPRGMRLLCFIRPFLDNCISIHASREGCDEKFICNPYLQINFNPRIPRGMRRIKYKFAKSIAGISIHASREGCDPLHYSAWHSGKYFNPRIPRGMRR